MVEHSIPKVLVIGAQFEDSGQCGRHGGGIQGAFAILQATQVGAQVFANIGGKTADDVLRIAQENDFQRAGFVHAFTLAEKGNDVYRNLYGVRIPRRWGSFDGADRFAPLADAAPLRMTGGWVTWAAAEV